MIVIPAIDLLDGKVVRLKKGAYDQATNYEPTPLEQARIYKDAGFNHIHIVDLNGARTGEFVNLPIIKEIIEKTGLSVQSGGGIRSFEDCEELIGAGISKIVSSSMAVKNRESWYKALATFGGDKCILGLDLKNGRVAYTGWTETLDESPRDFLVDMMKHGQTEVLCTDIARDGMLTGPNIALYKTLKAGFPGLKIIASGGVSNAQDLHDLSAAGLDSAVVGRAYYEGHLSLEEMAAV